MAKWLVYQLLSRTLIASTSPKPPSLTKGCKSGSWRTLPSYLVSLLWPWPPTPMLWQHPLYASSLALRQRSDLTIYYKNSVSVSIKQLYNIILTKAINQKQASVVQQPEFPYIKSQVYLIELFDDCESGYLAPASRGCQTHNCQAMTEAHGAGPSLVVPGWSSTESIVSQWPASRCHKLPAAQCKPADPSTIAFKRPKPVSQNKQSVISKIQNIKISNKGRAWGHHLVPSSHSALSLKSSGRWRLADICFGQSHEAVSSRPHAHP